MKSLLVKTFALLFALTFVSSVNAQSKTSISKFHPKYHQIEKNLLVGLDSDNLGLRVSSAYMLGEMESEDAVDPLVKMLREDDDEGARIMAALSLVKIGTDRGLFMVKRIMKFTDSERVKNNCKRLYFAYLNSTKRQQEDDVNQLLAFLETSDSTQIN